MSLLLSQLGGGSTTTLIADAGAVALAGRDAQFRTGFAAQTRAIGLTGRNALFRIGLAAQTTDFVQTGQNASLWRGLSAPAGSFVLGGLAAPLGLRFACVPAGFAGSGQPAPFAATLSVPSASSLLAGHPITFTTRMTPALGAFALAGSPVGSAAGEPTPPTVAGGGAGVRMSGANFSRRRYRAFADALARERKAEEPAQRRQTTRQSPAAAKTKVPRETYTLVARPAALTAVAGDVSACIACAGAGAKFNAGGGRKSFGLRVAPSPVRVRLRAGVTWFTAIGPLAWPTIESLPDLSIPRRRRRKTRRRRN